MTLPIRLLAARTPPLPDTESSDRRPAGRRIVQRGDIRRIEPCFDLDDDARLALVLVADSDKDSVEIMLVHPYVELATHSDLVFHPAETGASYSIVVEARVRSVVWTLQTRERVGGLSEEALIEVGKVAAAADSFDVSPRTGPPLAGPADSRWGFKRQEAHTLNEFAADRISSVFEDRLDPRWLSLSPTPQDSDVSPLGGELDTQSSEYTMGDLDHLQNCGAFNLNAYRKQFGSNLGCDIYISHMQPFDSNLALAA